MVDRKELTEWLISLGFSSNEASILLLLSERGALTVSEISKELRIAQPHVYTSLQELFEKGLVEKIGSRPARYCNLNFVSKLDEIIKQRKKYAEKMLNHIRSLSSQSFKRTIFFRNKEIFKGELLKALKSANHRVWIVIPAFSLIGDNIEKELMKIKNKVDTRIAISDIRYFRTLGESPSFIRYIQPSPPFILVIIDNRLFFAPIMGNMYLGISMDNPDLLLLYSNYFDHIWRDDYVRTLYRLRMTTPKEY